MSLQHFFLEDQDFAREAEASASGFVTLNLSDEDLHHAKVLRLKAGEHIGVIDSNGRFFEVEICEAGKSLIVKKVTTPVRYCHHSDQENVTVPDMCCHLWLCQGVAKGSKFDEVVRACTEIGVYGFIPVEFERSVVKLDAKKEASKIERWQKIAKSAAMQSGQLAIPKISGAVDVKTLSDQLADFDCVFVC